MTKKPEWLLFAEKVRGELANIRDTKSGKRSERHILDRYREACRELGYEGSLSDWHYLLGRRAPR